MIHAFPSAVYLLLFLLCLVFWPGKSPVLRFVVVSLMALLIVLICLPWYASLQVYYRVRLYLIDRKLRRLDKQMQRFRKQAALRAEFQRASSVERKDETHGRFT
jgi:4-amino-4-deoxy-L-arabinose transferase-like glycosyltransferase